MDSCVLSSSDWFRTLEEIDPTGGIFFSILAEKGLYPGKKRKESIILLGMMRKSSKPTAVSRPRTSKKILKYLTVDIAIFED